MSPFDILLVAHLVGDYLFQTSWMAAHKAKYWMPLLTHVLVYTTTVALLAWIGFGGLTLWGILLIAVSHVILDRRTFVAWWVRHIMRVKGDQQNWLMIMADQVFHIFILALVLQLFH